jgi:hypothetical protein
MAQDLLAGAVFPSGRPLSPSPRAWPTYDISLLARHGGRPGRRVRAADDEGEYPVFALDLDDMPFPGLTCPGIDVDLADTTGPLPREGALAGYIRRCGRRSPRLRVR